ncbi:hypothetical protein AAFF_G00289210 [Aldrovandia affinis]|uniref:C-type lectin domain-containing protein n=1 Tax=Aldrovandia affinis TaxID=143900 RepID=A0AAD7RCA4_9TELE|nr:hypothetical protein AAFF_G00289210 [Aldrovandia affinis]
MGSQIAGTVATVATPRQIHFVDRPMSWADALDFCRANFSDLASVGGREELAVLASSAAEHRYDGGAWIGLHDDVINTWQWSLANDSFYGDGEREFRRWRRNEPNFFLGKQNCTLMRRSRWTDDDCELSRRFVCYDDNLVLIRENRTWMEAVSFCRQHHVDLVSVLSDAVQGLVAQEARGASTPHVWLGLRYACILHFWFWVSPEGGCYSNWAPGRGPGGPGNCGNTGAMEAGGGHRWVSLPDSEQLNFICSTCSSEYGHTAPTGARTRSFSVAV